MSCIYGRYKNLILSELFLTKNEFSIDTYSLSIDYLE